MKNGDKIITVKDWENIVMYIQKGSIFPVLSYWRARPEDTEMTITVKFKKYEPVISPEYYKLYEE